MGVELSQFLQALQGTTPTGNTVKDFIQAAPSKSPIIAIGKTVSLGHLPFNKRIAGVFYPLRLVCGNTDILYKLIILFKVFEICPYNSGFENTRTPTVAGASPA